MAKALDKQLALAAVRPVKKQHAKKMRDMISRALS
jgi:hypothetical protein